MEEKNIKAEKEFTPLISEKEFEDKLKVFKRNIEDYKESCLLYTSPSPRD